MTKTGRKAGPVSGPSRGSPASFGPAPAEFPLYDGVVPNAKANHRVKEREVRRGIRIGVHRPTLTVFSPPEPRPPGAAIIIAPGGAYRSLYIQREGHDLARELAGAGVTAVVLKYRLPDRRTMKDPSIGPLQDLQQAIRLTRENAADWNIEPRRVGVMGCSAGGHLAATAATHGDEVTIPNPLRTRLAPDFAILLYPVLSFADDIGEPVSRRSLLGAAPTKEQRRYFSPELNVNARTPPIFLAHARDDRVVPAENSRRFARALDRRGVPCELHLYSSGGHGFLERPTTQEWLLVCLAWMHTTLAIPK